MHTGESKLPLFSYGRDSYQPSRRSLYTNYKDSLKGGMTILYVVTFDHGTCIVLILWRGGHVN